MAVFEHEQNTPPLRVSGKIFYDRNPHQWLSLRILRHERLHAELRPFI